MSLSREVERYDEDDCKCGLPVPPVSSPEGEFVAYSDYDALRAEVAEVKGERDALIETNNRTEALVDEARTCCENYERKLLQSQAALGRMREALIKLSTLGGGRSEGNCIAQEALRQAALAPEEGKHER